MDEQVFQVQVDYTDRTRNVDGSYVIYMSIVHVLAFDDIEASCIAVQLVSAIRHDTVGGMALASRVVI